MYPLCLPENEDVVKQNDNVRGLVVQEVVPDRKVQTRVIEHTHSIDKGPDLYSDSNTDGQPAVDVECSARVTLLVLA